MKRVVIKTDGVCLGDSIAFFPYFEEYRKKHDVQLTVMSGWGALFDNVYTEIEYLPWKSPVPPHDQFIQMKVDMNTGRGQPYQFQAAQQLGLPLKEIRPKLIPKVSGNLFGKPYVAIATQSTAQCKYWNFPQGWEILIQWLKSKGYEVICVDKERVFGNKDYMNYVPSSAKDWTGAYPIEYRSNEIASAEFFIGLGSGLSWLAWGLGKKVVMIAGHSSPDSEFKEDNYRVFNPEVCNNCWGDPAAVWNPFNWTWCPRHEGDLRHFECTVKITPKMVIEQVERLIRDKTAEAVRLCSK